MTPQKKIILGEEDIPKQWYNILPDLPAPLPPYIDASTQAPVDPKKLLAVFPKELVLQEVSDQRYIPIPQEVREVFTMWRPTPLFRATGLEKALKTPAKIYYKYEGVSPAGSHKPNTAVAQAYYNMKEGVKRLATETGAGQWGSALSFGCMLFDMDCTVYMVRISYDQKPYRRVMMQTWGAEVYPSPSKNTQFGRKLLAENPDNSGSLGIAISEAVEDTVTHDDTKYSLGSVLNHVLMHQTVIGLETIEQMKLVDDYPDKIFGCIGGGSSFSGMIYPFYADKKKGKAPKDTDFIAVEASACPSVTKGEYMFDFGDTGKMMPMAKMHTLGHDFVPPPIHSGGLRYHGMAPTLCLLAENNEIESKAYNQVEVFEAAKLFTQTEGIIAAPEPTHAIKGAIDEALRCKETGEEKTILFLLCGHGHFDMKAYDDFNQGKLPPYEYPKELVDESIIKLRKMYPWLATLPY